eukprot:TRINITY_DN97398_c0_g1_i1.p2 TRINITY_DN97398_c0_g1~~TRINITY_DN97398_c0_g1_i1.p2  ORF type:complete len:189 (+),score=29.79 TRINITY_DN97398_c0_g1_i1:58-567(+)
MVGWSFRILMLLCTGHSMRPEAEELADAHTHTNEVMAGEVCNKKGLVETFEEADDFCAGANFRAMKEEDLKKEDYTWVCCSCRAISKVNCQQVCEAPHRHTTDAVSQCCTPKKMFWLFPKENEFESNDKVWVTCAVPSFVRNGYHSKGKQVPTVENSNLCTEDSCGGSL